MTGASNVALSNVASQLMWLWLDEWQRAILNALPQLSSRPFAIAPMPDEASGVSNGTMVSCDFSSWFKRKL